MSRPQPRSLEPGAEEPTDAPAEAVEAVEPAEAIEAVEPAEASTPESSEEE